jgi:polar amino acid transport system substrate-binding protein
MKRLLLFVCLALAFPFALQAQTVTIATLDWPPYVGTDLKAKGFNSEIITEAFKRVGHTVKIEFMDWDAAIAKASQGKFDAVFPEYYSKDREKEFIYSNFFSNSLLVFYKRKDAKINYVSPKNLKDLSPYKIGVVKGYINTEEFDKASYLKRIESDSDEANLKKLLNKELDIIVIDKLVAQHIIKRDMPGAAAQLEALNPPLVIHPLFVIFPKKNPGSKKLCDDFNKGLEMITKDGTVKAIMSRSGLM